MQGGRKRRLESEYADRVRAVFTEELTGAASVVRFGAEETADRWTVR
jgi:hypothetical protein